MKLNSGLPGVSVGMPVYNGEKFIRNALDSLLAQDYGNFEIIICDNASTDKTAEICREYAGRDPMVKYHLNETNLGPFKNFGKTFELSGSEYFMWAAYDDEWEPSFISRCVEAMENSPSAVMSYSAIEFIDEDGKPFSSPGHDCVKYYHLLDNPDLSMPDVRERLKRLFGRNGWYSTYGLVRSEVLRKTRGMRSAFGSDVVLLMELCMQGPFAKVPEKLFRYRILSAKKFDDFLVQFNLSENEKKYPYLLFLYDILEAVSIYRPEISGKIYRDLVVECYRHDKWKGHLKNFADGVLFVKDSVKKSEYHRLFALLPFLPLAIF